MCSRSRALAKQVRRAPADDVLAVIEEGAKGVVEGELLGLAVVDRQEDHREALLHLSVLVQLVQHDLVLGATLQTDVNPHTVAVGLIAEFVTCNIGDHAFVDQLGDALHEFGLIDLVGDLFNNDRLTATGNLSRSLCASER